MQNAKTSQPIQVVIQMRKKNMMSWRKRIPEKIAYALSIKLNGYIGHLDTINQIRDIRKNITHKHIGKNQWGIKADEWVAQNWYQNPW